MAQQAFSQDLNVIHMPRYTYGCQLNKNKNELALSEEQVAE